MSIERAIMPGKRTNTRVYLHTASMLAGGFISVAAVSMFIDAGNGPGLLSFVLGAGFGSLGWFLAENIGEAIVILLATIVLGSVALINLESVILRTIVIAFLCGFNIGKLTGGVYREIRQ